MHKVNPARGDQSLTQQCVNCVRITRSDHCVLTTVHSHPHTHCIYTVYNVYTLYIVHNL